MIKIMEMIMTALLNVLVKVPLEFVAWGQANPVKAMGYACLIIILVSVVSTVLARD